MIHQYASNVLFSLMLINKQIILQRWLHERREASVGTDCLLQDKCPQKDELLICWFLVQNELYFSGEVPIIKWQGKKKPFCLWKKNVECHKSLRFYLFSFAKQKHSTCTAFLVAIQATLSTFQRVLFYLQLSVRILTAPVIVAMYSKQKLSERWSPINYHRAN